MPPAAADFDLQAIRTQTVGTRTGHGWEQWDLARAAKGRRLVNLGNSGPILHGDALVVIHDAAVFRTPANYGATYRLVHRTLGLALSRRMRIGTVSRFSRSELAEVLHIPAEGIFVAGNGCDHLRGQASDPAVLHRLAVEAGRYFLFVGTATPNKNLDTALRAFAALDRDDVRFVIAGSFRPEIYGGQVPEGLKGLVVAPGLSDAEVAALYENAAALVFPTRYEGFGIPPLEAMAVDCPVIASDIPVLRETLADAAAFFDPDDAAGLNTLMARRLDDPEEAAVRVAAGRARVAHYSWERAARSLADAITADPITD